MCLCVCVACFDRPPVGQRLLIIEAWRSHSDKPHSTVLLWTSDQLVAETCTWQHTTLTTDRQSCYPGGIRTRNPSKRASADPLVIPWQIYTIHKLFTQQLPSKYKPRIAHSSFDLAHTNYAAGTVFVQNSENIVIYLVTLFWRVIQRVYTQKQRKK